jgi:hypothetical protein
MLSPRDSALAHFQYAYVVESVYYWIRASLSSLILDRSSSSVDTFISSLSLRQAALTKTDRQFHISKQRRTLPAPSKQLLEGHRRQSYGCCVTVAKLLHELGQMGISDEEMEMVAGELV